jgi:hypothetical protein
MLTENEIKAHVKKLLPEELHSRLRIQTGVHGCYEGTVQVWLEGWVHQPTTIPLQSYQAHCKTRDWGGGPYDVIPKAIAKHILEVEHSILSSQRGINYA